MTRFVVLGVLVSAAVSRAETPCSDCWSSKCVEFKGILPKCAQAGPRQASPAPAAPKKAACPAGSVRTADTQGNCCWPGQAWSSSRSTCVGTPTSCPPGTRVSGEICSAQPAAPPADLAMAEQCVQHGAMSAEQARAEALEAQEYARRAQQALRNSASTREAQTSALRAQANSTAAALAAQNARAAVARARSAAGEEARSLVAAACNHSAQAQQEAQAAQQHSTAARQHQQQVLHEADSRRGGASCGAGYSVLEDFP